MVNLKFTASTNAQLNSSNIIWSYELANRQSARIKAYASSLQSGDYNTHVSTLFMGHVSRIDDIDRAQITKLDELDNTGGNIEHLINMDGTGVVRFVTIIYSDLSSPASINLYIELELIDVV